MEEKFYQTNILVQMYPDGRILVKFPDGWFPITTKEARNVFIEILSMYMVQDHFKGD